MGSRRQFFVILASGCSLVPLVGWLASPLGTAAADGNPYPVRRSEEEWRARLTPAQYRILRRRRTERAFSSPLDAEHRPGSFVCAGCGRALFSSETKFDSGTGWPSFWQPLAGAVGTRVDLSWLMVRTEAHCANCGGHLGHVFEDGPAPTGLRYCMNGLAMAFEPWAPRAT
jgi:peptide-methionine (R)-S-oxide reductase